MCEPGAAISGLPQMCDRQRTDVLTKLEQSRRSSVHSCPTDAATRFAPLHLWLF
jgi:hypothetical protein